jgi:magnesium chelatase subunit D
LQVNVVGIEDVDQRMKIAKMAEAFDADPDGFAENNQGSQAEMKEKISQARKLLRQVSMSDDLLRSVASTCIDLGVKTHRAEIVITRTAKTIAAFDGRTEVNQEDIKKAMELALAHRMRSRPFEPPTLNKDKLEKSMQQHQHEHQHQHQNQNPKQQKQQEQQPQEPDENQDTNQTQASKPQEQVFQIGTPIDVRAINMPRKRDRIARRKTSGRRMNTLALRNRGRYLRQRMPQEGKDIAIDATIRAAATYQKVRFGPNAIKIKSEDIREKERVGKTSAVVLFVVDASGSMGAMQRMESAKGAVLSLLMDSYQKRDKIGMVAFRGKAAELILPPCSSVDLALSRLQELPTGGKTPLSAGLSRALQLLQGEIRKDQETKPMMVLISDGRANVGMGGKIRDELMEISEKSKQLGVHTIVIDTEVVESSFMDMRLGYCQEIAETSGGKYYPISGLSSDALYGIVDGEQKLLFETNS